MALTLEDKIVNINNQQCRFATATHKYLTNLSKGKVCKKTKTKLIIFSNILEVMKRYGTSAVEGANCIDSDTFCELNKFLNKLILKPCE